MSEREPTWVALAADIRAVDGNHDLGAGALAEALVERGWRRTAARVPAWLTRLRRTLGIVR
jgi:hypothetical protein